MLLAHSPTHQRSLARQQPGVTVNLHGFSLGEGGFSTPKPQGGPCDKRGWDLQLAGHRERLQRTIGHPARALGPPRQSPFLLHALVATRAKAQVWKVVHRLVAD